MFTPQPNSETTVPLNFVITQEHIPPPTDTTTIVANDLVALEVLATNVPISGVWTQNGGTNVLLLTSIWLPALFTRGVAAPSNSLRADGTYGGFLPSYHLNFVAR